MRHLLAIVLCWFTVGCRSCPPEAQLETPQQTVATFRAAFACDARDLEYRCFSDRVKASFGTFAGYSIGREVIREENGALLLALQVSDFEERVKVEVRPDGRQADAWIDTGEGSPLHLLLVNQPEYRLFYADGTDSVGYAESARGEWLARDAIQVTLVDKYLERRSKPPYLVEIRSHWVIDALPGLEGAVRAAGGTRTTAP